MKALIFDEGMEVIGGGRFVTMYAGNWQEQVLDRKEVQQLVDYLDVWLAETHKDFCPFYQTAICTCNAAP